MADEFVRSRGYVNLYFRLGKVLIVRAVCIPHGRASQHDIYTEPLTTTLSERDATIGAKVKTAVCSTRLLQQFPSFNDPGYDPRLAELFGLKSPRNLYPKIKNVLIRYLDGVVEFSPMRNGRGGSFEGFSDLWRDKQPISIPFNSDDAAWGAAAREALARSV